MEEVGEEEGVHNWQHFLQGQRVIRSCQSLQEGCSLALRVAHRQVLFR